MSMSLAISGTIFLQGLDEGVWKRSLSDILGVNELGNRNEELGIKVYPNPATNYIELGIRNEELGIKRDKYVLTLRNIEGQEVLRKMWNLHG